jgi:hypothetical protein
MNKAAVAVSRTCNLFQRLGRSMAPENVTTFEPARRAWLSQALYAAATLGIADQLSDRPLSGGEVADRVGSHTEATFG